MFDFPLIEGAAHLNDNSSVVITEATSKKFFGNGDAIGKSLVFYSGATHERVLTVTGILKNPPGNSSFQFEVMANFDNQVGPDGSSIKDDDWALFADAVFLKLSHAYAAPALERVLQKYVPLEQNSRADLKIVSFHLQPLALVAEETPVVENNALYDRPQDSATYGPIVLAIPYYSLLV